MFAAVKRWLNPPAEVNPQLLMRYPGRSSPPPVEIPVRYQLRTYMEGDVPGWVALFNANGQLGEWDAAKVRGELDGSVVAGMQFFVVDGEDPVAMASVHNKVMQEEECWMIGWVATHPEHLGNRLGAHATMAAVRAALTLPERPVVLLTDDFRLPAIRVYLKLGFVPTYDHPTYPGRWNEVFARVGEAYAQYNPLARKS